MSILFSDDFESGDLSAWDSVNVTAPSVLEVSAEAARYGTLGCLAVDAAGVPTLVKTMGVPGEVWIRFDVRIVEIEGNVGNLGGIWQQKSNDNSRQVANLRLRMTASGPALALWLYDDAQDVVELPDVPVETGRWYCVELHIMCADSPGDDDGGAALYLDGGEVCSRFDVDNDQADAGRCVCNAGWSGSLLELHRDQVAVGTERIYPLRGYRVYHNTGAGPVDYETVRAVRPDNVATWTSSALTYPDDWRFAVRAYNESGEERNIDLVRDVTLLDTGVEEPARPNRPADLAARAVEDGKVRITFTYDPTDEAAACTHFHVCHDAGSGEVDYESPLGSVDVDTGPSTRYAYLSGALSPGVTHRFAVRAATADDVEDDGTDFIEAVPDEAAPDQPATLSAAVVR